MFSIPKFSFRNRRDREVFLTVAAAAVAVVVMTAIDPQSPRTLVPPFERFVRADYVRHALLPGAEPAREAYGRSGGVRVRFAMPGADVEYPIEVSGPPDGLRYQWVRLADAAPVDSTRTLRSATLTAPETPGFYRLSLIEGTERRALPEITVAVLVPFAAKSGGAIDGYRIGWYRGEGSTTAEAPPEGFVRVDESDANLQLTTHLRVADFLTHDDQDVWPRYAALDTRLLDKLELVFAELERWRSTASNGPRLALDVHSGFRTPDHNRGVRRAARDSRHQYGDAADVVVDADGDGRFTSRDARLVEVAVEQVEMRYPDLTGGMGLYLSRSYHTPYVHIDARGKRVRWRS